MAGWMRDMVDVALFWTAAYRQLAQRRDAFWRGFLVIVAIALLAGLPSLVTGLAQGVLAAEPASETAAARQAFEQGMASLTGALNLFDISDADRAEMLVRAEEGFDLALRISGKVADLPTALPRPVGRLLAQVGGWLSQPFADGGFPLAAAALGTWLGYGVWVMLAAKWLGGRGGLVGFFGTTAMFAVPHVLDIFAWVPYVGSLLAFVATIWGLAIYVKATAISHQISGGRALLAVALPLLVAIGVGLLLLAGLAMLMAVSVALGAGR